MKSDDIDGGQEFDWGRTSSDYAVFRPGYPQSFYDTLTALEIGIAGQRVLDLGTGTGVLARAFAARGAEVVGVDIAANQIAEARRLADEQGLDVTFEVCAAEDIDYPNASFDIVSSGQSWLYFDSEAVTPKVLDVMTEAGRLVLTNITWLPLKDPIALASEELVLSHNPEWSAANFSGFAPTMYRWARDVFDLQSFHVAEVPLPFTRETWRGRMLACRGVGAALTEDEVKGFDAEHASLLERIAPEAFTILHHLSVHAYVRKGVLWPDRTKGS